MMLQEGAECVDAARGELIGNNDRLGKENDWALAMSIFVCYRELRSFVCTVFLFSILETFVAV